MAEGVLKMFPEWCFPPASHLGSLQGVPTMKGTSPLPSVSPGVPVPSVPAPGMSPRQCLRVTRVVAPARGIPNAPTSPPHCPHVPALRVTPLPPVPPGVPVPQVRELCLLFTRGVDYRWQRMALVALQEVGPGGSYGCRGGVRGA